MSQVAIDRHRVISRGMLLWACGLAVGLVGGWATLTTDRRAWVPALLLWVFLAWQSPRFWGLAGALVGHGVAWTALLATASVAVFQSLPPIYAMQLAYGPAPLRGGQAEWLAELLAWFALSLGMVAIGAILTIWSARGGPASAAGRRRLRAG
jgi:hypothetical protein